MHALTHQRPLQRLFQYLQCRVRALEHGARYRKRRDKHFSHLWPLSALVVEGKLARGAASLLTVPSASTASSKSPRRLKLYARRKSMLRL